MSTKALNEALNYLENNPTADEAQAVRRRARKELEAIEKAARGLGQSLRKAPWDQQAWDDGLELMETIAKETT